MTTAAAPCMCARCMRTPRPYMVDVFLPGDELPFRISMAHALEARQTQEERDVAYWAACCANAKRNYPRWKCSPDNLCRYCVSVKELCD